MMLFTILLVLGWERLYGFSDHWQLEQKLQPLFRRQTHFSLARSSGLALLAMVLTLLVLLILQRSELGVLQFILGLVLTTLCIGAGVMRQHYRAYLQAAYLEDSSNHQLMAEELSLIHPFHGEVSENFYQRELQNALLWINYRYYLAPLFWLAVGGDYGLVLLVGYCFLRAWQGWLAKHRPSAERSASGVDGLLNLLDWLPVRLVGLIYVFLGHGERALPAWFKSIRDFRHTPYQKLALLARFALERDPCRSAVEMPRRAVALAKRTTLVFIVLLAVLTLGGILP